MKKKKNNKGFTLVELLAVLVILITILTIAIPSITASVERNKKNIFNKKIDIIEAQAESFVNLYKNKFSDYSLFSSGSCCIDIVEIEEVGLLSSDDLKDADDKEIIGFVCYDDNQYEYSNVLNAHSVCNIG